MMGSPGIGEGAADGTFKIDLFGCLFILAIVWLPLTRRKDEGLNMCVRMAFPWNVERMKE